MIKLDPKRILEKLAANANEPKIDPAIEKLQETTIEEIVETVEKAKNPFQEIYKDFLNNLLVNNTKGKNVNDIVDTFLRSPAFLNSRVVTLNSIFDQLYDYRAKNKLSKKCYYDTTFIKNFIENHSKFGKLFAEQVINKIESKINKPADIKTLTFSDFKTDKIYSINIENAKHNLKELQELFFSKLSQQLLDYLVNEVKLDPSMEE